MMRNRWCFFGAVLSIFFVTEAGAVGFIQHVRLTAADAAAGDEFGVQGDLSSDGTVALVAARGDDCGAGVDCGAGYVFVQSEGGWSQQAKLTASDPEANASFGHDVALSGNGSTALLKAVSSHCGGPGTCGVVYVFRRTGSSWTQEARLIIGTYPQFGIRTMALSEDGETALVGDPLDCTETGGGAPVCGSVHVFARSGGSWTEEARLSVEEAYQFGYSVDLSRDGGTALVGLSFAPVEPSGDFVAGYVLVRSGGEWSLQQRLMGTSSELYEESHWEVTLSGDGQTALMSSPFTRFGCLPDAQAEGVDYCGALSTFTSSGGAWTEHPLLHVGLEHFAFGFNSALSGDGKVLLASGASALAFERTGQSWLERQQLPGYPLALSEDGQMALTGISNESCASGNYCGAVYIFGPGAAAAGIPTASHLGLALLALLLAASGAWVLSRRRRSV